MLRRLRLDLRTILQTILWLLLGFWLSCCLLGWQMPPAWGAVLSDRTPLTLELLQERLKSPMQTEGIRMIDLRRLVIDLRSENAEFRDQFYRQIQAQLQRSSVPLGLDLSYSLIQGELRVADLGIRTPLYGQQAPIFSEAEQAQLKRDRVRLSQLSQLSRSLLVQSQVAPLQITVLRGPLNLVQTRFEGFVNLTNTFFLGRIEAQGASFGQDADWSEARFSQAIDFANATFQREARFRSSIFFSRARFNQAQFQGTATFQSSEFQAGVSFNQAIFQQSANLTRTRWQDNADLSQTHWFSVAAFDRAKFAQPLFLTEAVFEKLVSFRQAQFSQSVNLRGASILDQADFADAGFASRAYLNVPDLQFDPRRASLLGNPGQIGRVFSVPTLQGNETLLRNLVRNFRQFQQIADANQIQYTTERLRSLDLRQRLLGANLNTATRIRLQRVGFSTAQITEILAARQKQTFRSASDILRLETVDLATYVKVRDRIIAGEPLAPSGLLLQGLQWFGLSLLLLLTRYGTSSWLVFGVGLVAVAWFGLVFWLIDRVRRRLPQPILPTLEEAFWVAGGYSTLTLLGLSAIFRTADRPWLTLSCLALVIIPLPTLLLLVLYGRGRYHDLMETSYFVEDGTLRQLRFLIGRMPNIPSFPMFRERYVPLLWDRRWSWLYYFDFSLNNLLRFGFNDVRLRDQHLPGLVSVLVWYQWALGLLYFAFLLWTLSRTIPGLNLLIYFK